MISFFQILLYALSGLKDIPMDEHPDSAVKLIPTSDDIKMANKTDFSEILDQSLMIMNTSADVCTNFYGFACGNYGSFLRDKAIDYTSGIKNPWGPTKQQMELELKQEIRDILGGKMLNDLQPQHEYLLRQVRSYYQSCMSNQNNYQIFSGLMNEYFNDSVILHTNETIFKNNLLDLFGRLQWNLGFEFFFRMSVIKSDKDNRSLIYIYKPEITAILDIYKHRYYYFGLLTYVGELLEKLNMSRSLAQDIINFEETLIHTLDQYHLCEENEVDILTAYETMRFINLESLLRGRSKVSLKNVRVKYCENYIVMLNNWFKRTLPSNNEMFYNYMKVFAASRLLHYTGSANNVREKYIRFLGFDVSGADICQDETMAMFDDIVTATYIHKTGFKQSDSQLNILLKEAKSMVQKHLDDIQLRQHIDIELGYPDYINHMSRLYEYYKDVM
ncbi:uncharacterized protein LOC135928074 [Gordionus sp. m RMFG-2023]|uniref:uncharacterized protein LOC135928074 n=1 Tax=Gordionus sp. m RMFG-2023 TaxID=3053472 RepID=UPI0031FC8CFE